MDIDEVKPLLEKDFTDQYVQHSLTQTLVTDLKKSTSGIQLSGKVLASSGTDPHTAKTKRKLKHKTPKPIGQF